MASRILSASPVTTSKVSEPGLNNLRTVPFVKASACGNDFLIVEGCFAGSDAEELTRRMCDRHDGIGADGVEWLYPADGECDARIRLINADGSHAEISGNGTRCVAAWLAVEHGREVARIGTDAGVKVTELISRQDTVCEFKTSMGRPELGGELEVKLGDRTVVGVEVSMGNPHYVIFVDEFQQGWQRQAEEIQSSGQFPQGVNVEFVRVLDAHQVELRIFERGAGETRSSGTGTSAAAAAAIATNRAQSPLQVHAPGGTQVVRWQTELYLFGPAQIICRGDFFI